MQIAFKASAPLLMATAVLASAPAAASGNPCEGTSRQACLGGDTVSVAVVTGKKEGRGQLPDGPQRPQNARPGTGTLPQIGTGSAAPHPGAPEGASTGRAATTGTTTATVDATVSTRLADIPCATGEGHTPKLSCVNYTTAPPAPTTTTPASGTATAPAAPAAPTYTAEQAATQAWTTQTFTKATVAIQPTGNTTLTGLPTYFHATYGPDGLAPGETTTVTLLGHTITLRPTDVTYTYHYGDTTTHGPTTDAGGPYPTGTVTHTYPTKGTVTTRIDTTLSGQYQENNGPWHTIPGATTITGQPQQLTIATLQSRLHH